MLITVPISELKQRTGKILGKAVLERKDIIVERYGEEYAVIMSRQRYQELLDSAQSRVRERFLAAQSEVYSATEELSEKEIEQLVESTVVESRRSRAQLDESDS